MHVCVSALNPVRFIFRSNVSFKTSTTLLNSDILYWHCKSTFPQTMITLDFNFFKPLSRSVILVNHIGQCKHWPGDNVLWDRMIAISDRFAFRKHQISLSRLHKCTACEMCGFIFHMHPQQHNRYQKCFRGARVCFLSPVFLWSPLQHIFLGSRLHFQFTTICCSNITRHRCNGRQL